MLSKIDYKDFSVSSSTPPTLLAWSSCRNNKVSVIDLETKQNNVAFIGARISDAGDSWTHVKEIPDTNLLVSLHHNPSKSANMEIFDISKKGKANKIYTLGELSGSKLEVGYGDVTYNSRRSILSAIPVGEKIAYHLFTIDTSTSKPGDIVKLNRKSKRHSLYSTQEDSVITGFDFNPAGELIATINSHGRCLVSDVDTNNYVFHIQVGSQKDKSSRCRWSTNTDEPFLFVKNEGNYLNILDVEKKALTFTKPVQLDKSSNSNKFFFHLSSLFFSLVLINF